MTGTHAGPTRPPNPSPARSAALPSPSPISPAPHLTRKNVPNSPSRGTFWDINIVAFPPQDVTLLWMGLAAVGYAVLLLAAWRFRNQDLMLYSVAFCALLLLQPYSQKQSALVLLVWPAIAGAARAGSMPKSAKTAFYWPLDCRPCNPFWRTPPFSAGCRLSAWTPSSSCWRVSPFR